MAGLTRGILRALSRAPLARTIGRFAVFAAADLILTVVLSAALFGLVYRSVLLI